MKHLNLSFALIIAILAASTTIATKANFSGKRVITACFTQIQIKDVVGVTFDLNGSVSCTTAKSQAISKPIVNAAVTSTALPNASLCPGQVIFCCVQVVEMTSSDPLYASAPFINLGEGLRKYKIVAVFIFCKLE